jgi:hypothetical protein
MRKRIVNPVLMAALFAVALGGSASAENIALSDPSLENGFSGSNGTPVSGWFTFGATAGGINVSPGSFWNMSNPDGTNAAYAVNIGETDGGSIYQTVTLDAGVTYVLTAAVGMSSAAAKSDGRFALVFFNSGFGSLLAQTTGSVSTRGSFADHSVSFTPTVSGNYQIGMRNRGYVPGTGANNNQSTIFFDNVRLTTPSILFPTAINVASNDALTVRPVNVAISNNSASFDLDITGIQVTGTDAELFTVVTAATSESPFQIAAGTNGTLVLSFDPFSLVGNVSAVLEITSNEPGSPRLIPISGLIRDPWIDTVAGVTVPTLTTNTPDEFDVTINNLGTQDLVVDGVFLSGTDSSYFSVVTDFTSPLVIAAGQSDTVTFSFDPAGQERFFNANLEFDSNDAVEATRVVPVVAELARSNPAPLTLRLDGNCISSLANGTGLIPIAGAPFGQEVIDNTAVPPSSARNFYHDSDGDLAFTSPGDTSGNTNTTLAPNIIVSGNKVLNFYVDTDGNSAIADNFAGGFYRLNGLTITLSDGSKVNLDVTQGTPQTFTDPGGETWSVALRGVGLLSGPTTDIVGNVNSIPDGQGPDYHFTLTFTYGAAADFSSWALGFGIPDDPADDSDYDGIPALVEYGLGYDPTAFDSLPSPVASGSDFTITWPKGTQAATDAQISYVVQVSDDLMDWAPPEAADLAETASELVLTLRAGDPRTFGRISVVRTP